MQFNVGVMDPSRFFLLPKFMAREARETNRQTDRMTRDGMMTNTVKIYRGTVKKTHCENFVNIYHLFQFFKYFLNET